MAYIYKIINIKNNKLYKGKVPTVLNKITECCNHKRKTAYGYCWEFK